MFKFNIFTDDNDTSHFCACIIDILLLKHGERGATDDSAGLLYCCS